MNKQLYKAALQVLAEQGNEFAINTLKMGALVQDNGNTTTRESRIEHYSELVAALTPILRGTYPVSQVSADFITKNLNSLLAVL